MRWGFDFGRFSIAYLFFLLVGGGCTELGPDYARTGVAASPNWLEADNPWLKTGIEVQRQWWKTFNDPVLDRRVDTAPEPSSPAGPPDW
jgi:outer membrane protein TolC